jgi:hypothetical protein
MPASWLWKAVEEHESEVQKDIHPDEEEESSDGYKSGSEYEESSTPSAQPVAEVELDISNQHGEYDLQYLIPMTF